VTVSTPGEIRKGKLCVKSADAFSARLARFRDGPVEVTVERKHATRSQRANAYWWGVCLALVSEHTGYTADELHEFAKATFLPKKLAFSDGNGEVVGEYVVGGTTTRLNTVEFGEFIERFRQWAAETLDVVIPGPGAIRCQITSRSTRISTRRPQRLAWSTSTSS
jgi:hypothetical protein